MDIALWDIIGQYYNAPIYQLLGGPTRSEILTYAHVATGASPAEFAANLRRLAERGYRAAKAGLPLFYALAPTRASTAPAISGHRVRSEPHSERPNTFPRRPSTASRSGLQRVARQLVGTLSSDKPIPDPPIFFQLLERTTVLLANIGQPGDDPSLPTRALAQHLWSLT